MSRLLAKEDVSGRANPVVSIIVPAYDVSRYIAQAIESVLVQTFRGYEIIVVNDGSPDTAELERVLEPYRHHLTYLVQENRGCGAARNAALRVARGRYVALLDGDDFWTPDYLAVQVGLLEGDPGIDVVYPNAIMFGDEHDGRLFMDVNPSAGDVSAESLISERCVVMVSVCARRESIVRAGLFDESLARAEDFDLWLRILETGGRIGYHRKPLVHYRRRRGSLSADPVAMFEHALRVFDKLEARRRLSVREQTALARRRLHIRARVALSVGKQALASGDIKAAIENLTEANRMLNSRKLRFVILGLRTVPGFVRRGSAWRESVRHRRAAGK